MCLIASVVHSLCVNRNESQPEKAVVYLQLVISGMDSQGAKKIGPNKRNLF